MLPLQCLYTEAILFCGVQLRMMDDLKVDVVRGKVSDLCLSADYDQKQSFQMCLTTHS